MRIFTSTLHQLKKQLVWSPVFNFGLDRGRGRRCWGWRFSRSASFLEPWLTARWQSVPVSVTRSLLLCSSRTHQSWFHIFSKDLASVLHVCPPHREEWVSHRCILHYRHFWDHRPAGATPWVPGDDHQGWLFIYHFTIPQPQPDIPCGH